MSLKPDYEVVLYDVSCFSTAVGTRGGVVCYTGAASGTALDQSAMTAAYVADPSGYRPVGILLNDVVNKDLTQTHLSQQKNEVQVGSKMTIAKMGWVVTNMIEGTPTVGGKAYVGHSGYISATELTAKDANTISGVDNVIGRFDTIKNADGFCRVYINVR